MTEEHRTILAGEDALDLWRQGRKAWNDWVKKHPDANIDFSKHIFIPGQRNENIDLNDWPFAGFIFPRGKISFYKTQFENQILNFTGTIFRGRDINFSYTKFIEGKADFASATFETGTKSFQHCIFEKSANFSSVNFGNGNVNFSHSSFCNDHTNFQETKFNYGDIDFSYAVFKDGDLDFSNASFNYCKKHFKQIIVSFGDVLFSNVDFGENDISFEKAEFRNGNISFEASKFGKGNVSFADTLFGYDKEDYKEDIKVNFTGTYFGEGKVSFAGAKFGNKDIEFSYVDFGEGNVSFKNAVFSQGDIFFWGAKFGNGWADFSSVTFGKGKVNYRDAKFKGLALFRDLKKASDITSFSFKYATFEGPLDISTEKNEALTCIPDLTNTKTSHHVSLEGLKCILQKKESRYVKKYIQVKKYLPNFFKKDGDWLRQKTAIDKDDAERLCRLKELAENNKDHFKAIEFHVMEMKAKRKFKPSRWWPAPLILNLEFWFEKLSDFGRSVELPLSIFILLLVVFSGLYNISSYLITSSINTLSSLAFGVLQLLPFLPSSRTAKEDIAKLLYPDGNGDFDIPSYVYLLSFTQSITSLVLIFLIGLALKHRFKL